MTTQSSGPDLVLPPALETLASFVPHIVSQRFEWDPEVPTHPSSEQLNAVLLQCDLSGFTKFTERLARLGPQGAEEVSRSLSLIFAKLVELVAGHGGDVVKFAGDALTAIWPIPGTPVQADEQTVTLRRAAWCAFAIQEVLKNDSLALEHGLKMRAGIGVGEITVLYLGGIDGRWDMALVGQPLAQVGAAQSASDLGSVALSPEAFQILADAEPGLKPTKRPGGAVAIGPDGIGSVSPRPLPGANLGPGATEALLAYVPNVVRAQLAAGQAGYLAELRRVTVMFVDLPVLTSGAVLAKAQDVVVTLQATLERFEGSFHKLSIDDKGVKLIGVFGLPSLSHEDDPVRAVVAGREMLRRLQDIDVETSIGVTTGRAFCGVLGGEKRREYTVIGDIVNLSARLMQSAQGEILCDEETYKACQMRLAFRASRPIAIKGKSEPIVAYSPTGEHLEDLSGASAISGHGSVMVGRDDETSAIEDILASLASGRGEITVIEGEAGIGKSRLIEYALSIAPSRGVRSLVGAGDAIEAVSPYRAWRPILNHLLGLDRLPPDREARRNRVIDRLGQSERLANLAPLINAILPLDIPDNGLTSAMAADTRAENVQLVVTSLVQTAADEAPLLFVFDDAQWLDPSSWQLARTVFTNVRSVAAIVGTRPPGDPPPIEYQAFLRATMPRTIHLGPMPPIDIRTLLCNTLGIDELADEVMDLLHDKAEGHPMFSKELAYYLRDEGLVVTEPSPIPERLPVGVLAPHADLRDVTFPDTVQVVITSRIDRLEVRQQVILKVASVIGRVFSLELLRGVHPEDTNEERFEGDIDRLVEADLIAVDKPAPNATYGFRHAIVQEVAYGLLPFADRRNLHRAVGEWYERVHGNDLDPYLPVLAHHWTAAEDGQRAMRYQAAAGEQALANFANEEAITYLGGAIDLAGSALTPVDPLVLASWELQMGAAQIHWSRYPEGRHHLQKGLALLGHPVPKAQSAISRTAYLSRALVRQWRNRLFGSGRTVTDPDERATLLTASRAYTRLVEAAFLSGDQWLALYSSFHALNLAESSGTSPELAEAYGPVGVIYGAIPFRSEARRYLDRAVDTARAVNSPSALGYALLAHGTYSVGAADWSTAKAMSDDLVDLGRRFGARKRLSDGLQLQTSVSYLRGEFEACLGVSEELRASATRGHDPRFMAYADFAKAYASLYLGRADEALALVEQIPDLLGAQSVTTDRMLELMYQALRALVYLRLEREADALRAALDALALQAGAPLDLGFAVPGYALTADVLLTLSQSGHLDPQLRDGTKQATRSLKKFARLYEVGRPWAKLSTGSYAWLDGKTGKAVRWWRSAVAEAEDAEMPFVAGLAHLKLARGLRPDGSERIQQAEAARRIFTELGTPIEHQRAVQLLESAE